MIYGETDYRQVIKQRVEALKGVSASINFQSVAKATSMPSSYISKVMNGVAEFNGDQLYRVARFLGFSSDEQDYLQLLLEYARSQFPERRGALEQKIRQVRAKKLEATQHLTSRVVDPSDAAMAEYYYNPVNQIVHIALSIPRYQRDPAKLRDDLGLAGAQFERALGTLVRLGIVSKVVDRYKVEVFDIHLSREHVVYETWRDQIRLLSVERLKALDQENSYSFSVVFNASEPVRLAIQAQFMKFLEEIKREVDGAQDEECYQINFDLLRWTAPAATGGN